MEVLEAGYPPPHPTPTHKRGSSPDPREIPERATLCQRFEHPEKQERKRGMKALLNLKPKSGPKVAPAFPYQ